MLRTLGEKKITKTIQCQFQWVPMLSAGIFMISARTSVIREQFKKFVDTENGKFIKTKNLIKNHTNERT